MRKHDGSLYDSEERREVAKSELLEFVRGGGRFDAVQEDDGAPCTYQILAELIADATRTQTQSARMMGESLSPLGNITELVGILADRMKSLRED